MDPHGERREARARMSIGRGQIKLVDDTAGVQRLQIDIGPIGPDGQSMGIRDATPRIMDFGLISVPPLAAPAIQDDKGVPITDSNGAGVGQIEAADAIVIFPFGDQSNAVIIGTNHKSSRPTGNSPGDSGLYDLRGTVIALTAAGLTITVASGLPCTIKADHVVINSDDIQLGGEGGKRVVLDGDPVSTGGTVSASSNKVTAS